MIQTVFVPTWWNGYATLLSDRKPTRSAGIEPLKAFLRKEVRGMYYNPIPFMEFRDLSPLRHYPHERLAKCADAESFAGKVVVDIGASMGYYVFLAAEMGAKRAVGIETYDNGCHVMRTVAELYGFQDLVEVFEGNVLTYDFANVDVVMAFSVLPYLGQASPEPLRRMLAHLAANVGVSFIEMGDGGSALEWCRGDGAFEELFYESGFRKVTSLGPVFASHSNTQRTLWECRGTR